ncbi:hypothetical protein BT69DRAFT_366419 [Atractiella rhizophila]|nr:hypothetical protein BT69DRAFT_366419 [Atractiella rhizophila]
MPDVVVNWISFCAFFSLRVFHLLENSKKRQHAELSSILLSAVEQLAEQFQSAASSSRPHHLLARHSLLMHGLVKVARSRIDVIGEKKRLVEAGTLDMVRKSVGIHLHDEPSQPLLSQARTHTSPSASNQAAMFDLAGEAYQSFDWLQAFLPAATFMSEGLPNFGG